MTGGGEKHRLISGISHRRKIIIICLAVVIAAAAFAQMVLHPDRRASVKIVCTGAIQGNLNYVKGKSLGYDNISIAAGKSGDSGSDNVILADMGDCLGGSEVAEADGGADIVSIMNAAGYDAMVPGSLDFVYGTDSLKKLRSQSQFPFLAANIKDADNKSYFEDYKILNVKNVRIGIIGVTGALNLDDAAKDGLTVSDPSDTVSAVVSEISSKVDTVIVLAYVSDSDEISQIAAVDKVSAVITAAGDQASSDKTDKGTVIVSPQKYGASMGVISMNVSRDRVTADTKFIKASDVQESPGTSAVAAAVKTAAGDFEASEKEKTGYVSIAETGSAAETEEAAETESETVSETQSSGESSAAGSEAAVRYNVKETAIGDLTADAMLYAGSSSGVKAALIRDRDINGTLSTGQVSRGDVNALFDDDLYMVVCSMTGGELRTILEDSFKGYPKAKDFLQVSGLTYTYTSSTDIGSPLSAITIDLQTLEDGKTYTVALSSDLAGDYGYASKSSGLIKSMKSVAALVNDYIARNQSKKSSSSSQTEDGSGTQETEAARIKIK